MIIIPVITYIALQIPAIQTVATKSIVRSFNNDIDGEIEVGKIYMLLFNRVYLQDVSIKNLDGETLVLCNKLFLSIPPSGLVGKKIKLNEINIKGGIFNLDYVNKRESNLTEIFRIDPTRPEKIPEGKSRISVKRVSISDFKFRYFSKIAQDQKNNPKQDHISFTDLELSDIDIKITGFELKDAVFSGKIEYLTCVDKSGFKIEKLTSLLEMGFSRTSFRNLRLKDGYSEVVAPLLSFDYSSPRILSSFSTEVTIEGVFQETKLSSGTLGEILPALADYNLSIFLEGDVKGKISDLYTPGLRITLDKPENQSNIFAKGRLRGVGTNNKPIITLDSLSLLSNKDDIDYLLGGLMPGKEQINFIPEADYSFAGSLKGPFDSLRVAGALLSDIGSVDMDVILENKTEPHKKFSIDGGVNTHELNLGAITNIKGLQYLSLGTDAEFTLFPEQEDFSLRLGHLDINSLIFNGYNYSDIHIEGLLTNELFDGVIKSDDPNLQLAFNGSISLPESSIKSYQFDLDLPYINLSSLNLDKRSEKSEISLNISSNIKSSTIGDYIGSIKVNDINLANDYGSYDLGKMEIISLIRENMLYTTISSSFLNVDYRSSGKLSDFINKLGSIASVSAIGRDIFPLSQTKDSYYLELTTAQNISNLAQFIMPELFISPGSKVNIRISPDNEMDLKISSETLALKHNYLKNTNISLSNRDSLFAFSTIIEELSAGAFKLKNNALKLSGRDNNLDLQYRFSNNNGKENNIDLSSLLTFQDIDIIKGKLTFLADLQIDSSSLTLQDEKWEISPASILLGDKYYEVNDLKITNRDQKISLDGTISNFESDILRAEVNNFDLSILNSFTDKEIDLNGKIGGSIEISDLFKTPDLIVDLYSDSISVYKDNIGSLRLLSKRDMNNDNINILIENRLGSLQPLNILGFYQPNGSLFDFKADISSFPLSIVELFTDGIISQTKGALSCNLNITQGDNKAIKITGKNARLENFSFLIDYTNVPYTLNGPLSFEGNSIVINEMEIRDRFNNTGALSGNVKFNSLKDIRLDSRILFQNMHLINTAESSSEPFYGSIFGGGNINIGGNLNKITLDVNTTTAQNSSLHIPLSNYSETSRYNILTIEEPFIESTEPDLYALFAEQNKKEQKSTELDINLRVTVLENTAINLEIDKSTGDVLRAEGSGVLNMNINPSNNRFDIKGNYTISSGSYKFVYLGFGSRDFTLQNGGTIMFNGDIMSAVLDASATYRTKATIAPLIGESSDYRRNIECSLHLGGYLSNPELKFSIDIPDLAPSYRAKVESALSTEDKILTQFMALLITGSFVVNEGGQGVGFNNSTILYSNASEIISNQVSNIFRQLNIPIDLGFNYQVDSRRESEMFDMAISAQLFNNRVFVNGSIGSTTQYNTNRDIAGDIDIEIKLDQNGRVRLNLFSHSADPYTNYLDDTQRNGLGIIYQNEFNTFKEMVNNIFLSRKKREELEEERIRQIIRQARPKDPDELP